MYHMGPLGHIIEPAAFQEGASCTEFLPIRFSATHLVTDRAFTLFYIRLILVLSKKELRERFRIHEGTHTEVQYALLSFGLPVETLPLAISGDDNVELKVSNHLKWIQKRQSKAMF